MALQKTKTISNGVDFNYHKIQGIQYKEGEESLVTIASYLSKAARNNGKDPIEVSSVYLMVEDKTNLIGSAYLALIESKKDVKIITPEVSEVVTPAVMDGITIVTPAVINVITPAVIEETELNFFADAVEI